MEPYRPGKYQKRDNLDDENRSERNIYHPEVPARVYDNGYLSNQDQNQNQNHLESYSLQNIPNSFHAGYTRINEGDNLNRSIPVPQTLMPEPTMNNLGSGLISNSRRTSYSNISDYNDPPMPTFASPLQDNDNDNDNGYLMRPYQTHSSLHSNTNSNTNLNPNSNLNSNQHNYFFQNDSSEYNPPYDEEMAYNNSYPIMQGDQYDVNTYDEEDIPIPDVLDDENASVLTDNKNDKQIPYDERFGSENNVPIDGNHPRRYKTVRRVRLYRGNLVLDCPIANRLKEKLPADRTEREFTYMRYSAATCDPSKFAANEFTLRQNLYEVPRSTELFIVVTLYNEDDILLARTLKGVFNNIKHLSSRNRSKTWGADAWKKVVVCVVADGREKINPRARSLLAALGVYQEGFAKNMVNDEAVVAHIYEYTTMVGISSVGKTVKLTTENTCPVQMMFCLKEKNLKKINSHRWFFQGFGPIINPNICVLLDAGTKPSNDSIYHLWKAFDLNPNIGGACGEIKVMKGAAGHLLMNPLVAAQNFEYKMSNILDKPLESVFGFISVLPGAFSAYRYIALQNDITGQGPLEKYFKGETLHDAGAGLFTSNMYLAEDRILCFELVAKRGCKYVLKYVRSAYAETDVPNKIAELVLQRRRWLNGSFFAGIYAIFHAFSIWRSSHSVLRKLCLHVEFFYQTVQLLFSWFGIGNFFLIFAILTNSLGDPSLDFSAGRILGIVLMWLYVACIITCFILSFGNRPNGSEPVYLVMVLFWACLMGYLMFAVVFVSIYSVKYTLCENGNVFTVSLLFSNSTFRNLVISLLSTYVLYFVSSLIFFDPWHLLTSFLQYILLSPSYVNVLNVYAFCNIHDISWGTKGDTGQKLDLGIAKTSKAGKLEMEIPTEQEEIDKYYISEIENISKPMLKENIKPNAEEKEKDYYALIRTTVVLIWMFTNIGLCAFIMNYLTNFNHTTPTVTSCGKVSATDSHIISTYLGVVLWAVTALAAFRFIGSTTYSIKRLFGR